MLSQAFLAVEAGIKVLQDFQRRNAPLEVSFKESGTDYVTQVDRAIEDAVFGHLRQRFPRHRYLAEEGGGDRDLSDPRPLWILDPLDGTANFAHGFPHYAIALAQWADGAVQLAVVHDPTRGETFSAQRGRGARLGQSRMRGSELPGLNGALLANSAHSPRGPYSFDNLAARRKLYRHDLIIRYTGSAVLDLAYVAAGRLDGFWGNGLHLWDMAAGALLLEESGCLVGDFRGHPEPLGGDHLLAAARGCYPGLLAVVREHFAERKAGG